MNSVASVRVRFENLRSLASGLIGAGYTGVGLPFANPIRLLKFTNITDANIIVSLNGIDDIDIVPAQSFALYDFTSNKSDQSGFLELPAGDRVYIRLQGAAATTGSFYVTALYASQQY